MKWNVSLIEINKKNWIWQNQTQWMKTSKIENEINITSSVNNSNNELNIAKKCFAFLWLNKDFSSLTAYKIIELFQQDILSIKFVLYWKFEMAKINGKHFT